MFSLAEIEKTDEAIIVSRILVSVHKAIDQHFQFVSESKDRFGATPAFSDESTETGKMPTNKPDPGDFSRATTGASLPSGVASAADIAAKLGAAGAFGGERTLSKATTQPPLTAGGVSGVDDGSLQSMRRPSFDLMTWVAYGLFFLGCASMILVYYLVIVA